MWLAARRASDLRREVAAAAASSSESLAALRKEAEQSHTIHTNDQQTIARLSAELEACKEASDAQLRRSEEALAIKAAAAAARSESMASMAMGGQFEEEVRKSKAEMRRAMDSADDAQREASEARERVRELELELEKQRVQGAGEAGLYHRRRRTTHGQGKHPPPSEASQPPPPPPQQQQQQQQPGLVITPEALNW
jgi:hypothetical protein